MMDEDAVEGQRKARGKDSEYLRKCQERCAVVKHKRILNKQFVCYLTEENDHYMRTEGKKKFGSFSNFINAVISSYIHSYDKMTFQLGKRGTSKIVEKDELKIQEISKPRI